MKKEEEVKVVLLAFAIKEEVETMIPTIAIKLKQFAIKIMQKKRIIEWHTKISARIHIQVIKLHLLSLGSTIVTPRRFISF